MMQLSKKILVALGILLVVGISFALVPQRTTASEIYFCDFEEHTDVLCLIIDAVLPQFELDVFNSIEGVLLAEIDGDTTTIIIDPEIIVIPEQEIRDYIDNLEINTKSNEAQITVRGDGQSAPLCLRDVINGNINGVYSGNNGLFVVTNDVRCPS